MGIKHKVTEIPSLNQKKRLLAQKKDVILIAEFLLILALYAYLIIRDTIPVAGLIVIGIFWLILWFLRGQFSNPSPVDLPILALGLLLLFTLAISSNLTLTMPKVYGLVLCFILFYTILNFFNSLDRLQLVILSLLILSLTIPVVGFLATDWTDSTFTLPSRLLSRLGQYLPVISRFSTGGGIHVNTLGGTLTFFIPLLLSMLWDARVIKRTYLANCFHPSQKFLLLKITIIISLVLSLVILVFTQSRGSLLGVAAGVIAFIIWRNPRVYWLIPFLIVTILASFLVFGDANVEKFISILDTSNEGETLQVRLDYWKRTVFMIQDFPFTGVGLGTYGKVFDEVYTFIPNPSGAKPPFYAHNMYLAVAASMGLPALVLYFALFSSTATMVISTYKKVRSVARILLMGLSCGILANLVYGLWDNYLLGEKLAIVLWIFLGVITAIYVHQDNFMHRHSNIIPPNKNSPRHTLRKGNMNIFFIGFGNWFLFSLAAIAFININPYISLIITIVGGIILGLKLTTKFKYIRNLDWLDGKAVDNS